jgi:hypothetical protein
MKEKTKYLIYVSDRSLVKENFSGYNIKKQDSKK